MSDLMLTAPAKKRQRLKLKAPVPTEYQEQEIVVAWARVNTQRYPALKLLFAVPNGAVLLRGPSRFAILGQLHKQGCLNGIPDLCLPVPSHHSDGNIHYLSLWLEMKRTKGGVLSPEQEWCMTQLRFYGHRVEVCPGAKSAIAVLEDYLR